MNEGTVGHSHAYRVVVRYDPPLNEVRANDVANHYMETRLGADWDEHWKIMGLEIVGYGKAEVIYYPGTHLSREDIAERRLSEAL